MLNGLGVIIESWYANKATSSKNSFFVIVEVRGSAIVMICPFTLIRNGLKYVINIKKNYFTHARKERYVTRKEE